MPEVHFYSQPPVEKQKCHSRGIEIMVEFVENMVQIEIPRQIVSLLRTACNFQRQMVFSVLTSFTKVLNRQATTSNVTY